MKRTHFVSAKPTMAGSILVALVSSLLAATSAFGDVGPRQAHTIVFDSSRHRFVLFGGTKQPGFTSFNDVWVRASGSTADWTPLVTTGTPPHVRYSHAAMYDPNYDRMIVFGGYAAGLLFADVWALDFTTDPPAWTQIATTAGPSGRSNQAAVYDRFSNQMVVFGGVKPELTQETWWLDFNTSPATWTLRSSSDPLSPSAREDMVAVWKEEPAAPYNSRMYLFGGLSNSAQRDVWQFTFRFGAQYSLWSVDGITPRSASAGFLDDAGNRMIVFGGGDGTTIYDQTMAWSLSTPFQWTDLAPGGLVPGPRRLAAMAFDPFTRTAVMQGGVNGNNPGSTPSYEETWTLSLDPSPTWSFTAPQSALAVGPGAPAGLRLDGFVPNPATRNARVSFSLAGGAPATIEIVDVGGRRVAAQRYEASESGAHSIALAPSCGLAPGLYFVRLTQGTHVLTARGTIMK